jgi:hypothetical protein
MAENLQNIAFIEPLLVRWPIYCSILAYSTPRVKGAAVSTIGSQIVAAYAFDLFTQKTKSHVCYEDKSLFLINLPRRIKDVRADL